MQLETVEINGVGQVLFERSKKAKHLNISVKPFKGVRVAVLEGLSFKKEEKFFNTKTDWINKQEVKMKEYENRSNSPVTDNVDRVAAKRKPKNRKGLF